MSEGLYNTMNLTNHSLSFKLALVASLTVPGTGLSWNVTLLLVFCKNTLSDERRTV